MFGGGHIRSAEDLGSATIEYLLDAGVPQTCGASETAACAWSGSCSGDTYDSGPGVVSSTFSFTSTTSGGASGTQTVVFAVPDGGAGLSCTYEVTFAP
jgi:hypothetical protein